MFYVFYVICVLYCLCLKMCAFHIDFRCSNVMLCILLNVIGCLMLLCDFHFSYYLIVICCLLEFMLFVMFQVYLCVLVYWIILCVLHASLAFSIILCWRCLHAVYYIYTLCFYINSSI